MLVMLVAGVVAASAFAQAGLGSGSDAAHGAKRHASQLIRGDGKASGKLRGKKVRNRGRLGHGKLFDRPPQLSADDLRRLERKFSKVNPSYKLDSRGTPPPPTAQPLGDAEGDPHLGQDRLSDPLQGAPLPELPAVPSTGGTASAAATVDATSAGALAGPGQLATSAAVGVAAANDYVLFRNQPLAPVSSVTPVSSQTSEPTVANDRDTLLYTGNWYAAVSADNGINWQYPDPFTQFDAPSVGGGFCCDQKAYAVDRGGYSLVFWFQQYARDGNGNNTQRLVTYQGRGELQDQADYCVNDFTPQGDFDLPNNRWLDFPQVASSGEHLYMSSNVFDTQTTAQGGTVRNFRGSVVWRIPLDDLDGSDCAMDFTYWDLGDNDPTPGLVQGAGSTMYWATHNAGNTGLRIHQVADSSTTATWVTRDITDFVTTNGSTATTPGSMNCPVPDGTDPCQRGDARIVAGWRASGEVGWLWNVAQGDGYSFPHIQGARFDASNLSKIDDVFFFNNSFAWVYPAVAPNADGHLGLTLYRIGGGQFPRARTMLIDDVTGWGNLQANSVVTSTSGTASNRWGDYGGALPYGDCTGTWAGAVYSMQGGSQNGNAEARFIWFGRERAGCPDLIVELVGFGPNNVGVGETIYLGETTRNIGSGGAGPSTTRFYLSRDTKKSSSDLLLGGDVSVAGLGPSEGAGSTATATIPTGAHGTYYLLACADDTDQVSEITSANNCKAAGETVVVPLSAQNVQYYVDGLDLPEAPIGGGTLLRLGLDVDIITTRTERPDLAIEIWLTRTPDLPPGGQLLTSRRLPVPNSAQGAGQGTGGDQGGGDQGGGEDRRLVERSYTLRVRLPERLQQQHYYIAACVGGKAKRSASRCLVSREPLHVKALHAKGVRAKGRRGR